MTDLNYDGFSAGDWIIHDDGVREGWKARGWLMFWFGFLVGLSLAGVIILIGGAL